MIHWDMLKKPAPEQTALEMVTLDSLVPKDHLLRKIDAVIDFSFIHDRVAGLYCADNGRPPLDPTLMFKALFLGYLFGVRSERQLVREIEVNVAYRWFLRMKLTDPVFDASTLSQNRRRRFNDTSVAQDIFDAIVEQAIRHGLVDGTVLYTDSTHLKANANKGKYDLEMLKKSRADYWADLDRAIEAERAAHGQKPLKEKEREPDVKETKVSRTDPDSGYMVRDGKPKGFFYLDHRTVDGRHAIITDTHVTPANVHDSIVYLERLDRQRERFGFDVGAVGLDAGYATAGIAKGLEDRAILGVTGYRNPTPPKDGMMRKSKFVYEPDSDGYRCHRDSCSLTPPPTATATSTTAPTRRSAATARFWHRAPQTPRPSEPSPGMFGRMLASAPTAIARHRGARQSTPGAKRRSNARLPTPSNSTGTATPASAASSRSDGNACLPPPRRTSRRSQWQ